MSSQSVSFPSAGPSSQDEMFYSTTYDPSSSFQMNPLSSHPPRTPRTSVISNNVYATYETKEQVQETPDSDEEDEAAERAARAERRVRREDIWRDMFLTSNGRDKAFKLIQYSLKFYLLFHTSLTGSRLLRRPARPPWEESLLKRLQSTASGLSFSRKTLLLFNWLSPLTAIMAQQAVPYSSEQSAEKLKKKTKPFLHAVLYAPPPVLLELVNAFSDDLYTLSLLGFLGKRTGERAARFSDWCWLFATLVGLVENGVERQVILGLQHDVESRLYQESMSGATTNSKPAVSKLDEKELSRLQKQDYWLQITRAKLAMDLIFVSYDLFNIKGARETVKTFTGLAAAILSCAKLFDRHKSTLAKALNTR
ncbi:hypothetical protein C8J56DRAFT_782415 [Mycena floridula]|nr:hypothetical protein C8J56DRAFT_782415 [Mycena floridula]